MARQRQATSEGAGHAPAPRAIGYVRVSTALQRDHGMGLDVQRDAIAAYTAEHGLELVDVVREAASGGVRDGEVFAWE